MSTEPPSHLSIPITYSPMQSGVRLLELPPELVEQITSRKGISLDLKSAPPSTTDQSPSHVVLCTPTSTYTIRQVQTSNTVYALRPSTSPPTDPPTPPPLSTPTSFNAFATLPSTLELHRSFPSQNSKFPAQHLTALLQPYHGPSAPLHTTASPRGKSSYFTDVPFSTSECEEAWRGLCCFEIDPADGRPENAQAYVATPGTLLEMWGAIMKSVDVTSRRLEKDTIIEIAGAGDWPGGLVEAMLALLSATGDAQEVGYVRFRQETVMRWLGGPVIGSLIAPADGRGAGRAVFFEAYKPLVPAEWLEDDVGKRVLEQLFVIADDAWAEDVKSVFGGAAGAEKEGEAKGRSKRIGKSTDWHEKFKKAKR